MLKTWQFRYFIINVINISKVSKMSGDFQMMHTVPNVSICHVGFQVCPRPSFTLKTLLLELHPDPLFWSSVSPCNGSYPVPALPLPPIIFATLYVGKYIYNVLLVSSWICKPEIVSIYLWDILSVILVLSFPKKKTVIGTATSHQVMLHETLFEFTEDLWRPHLGTWLG